MLNYIKKIYTRDYRYGRLRSIKRISLSSFGRLSLRKLKIQEDLIHGVDWDNLIILDACRYDYFEDEYKNYFNGNLERVRSPASNTYTWLNAVFNEWYDVTVYSAHPVLNSLGVQRSGYKALPHFNKIIDVWNWGWNKKLSTVSPTMINEAILEDKERGDFKGRNIIWYMQPHAPWIGETKLTRFSKEWNDNKYLLNLWCKIGKGEIEIERLREAYRDNLRLVLQSVSELIPHLSGKTIVSSDHGEFLGEFGILEHPPYFIAKILCEVPWLEIKK